MAVAAKSRVVVTAAASSEWAAPIERWCERNLRWIFPAPAVAAMVLLMIFPLLYTGYLSLHQWYSSSLLGPEFVGLKN